MKRHELIPLEEPEAWGQCLRGINCGYAYTWQYCHSMYFTTRLKTFLYRYEDSKTTIVCPIVERTYEGYKDIAKPYGFSGFASSGDNAAFATGFTEFARQQGWVCGYLAPDPLAPHALGFQDSQFVSRGAIIVLDLTLGDEQLYAGMSANRRRQLRAWKPDPKTLLEDSRELRAFFLEHYDAFMKEKDASPIYHFSYETLALLSEQDGIFLIGLRDDAGIAGVSVFSHFGTTGEYLFHVPRPGDPVRCSVELMWAGIQRLRRLGIQLLNLGGSDRDDGVMEFKRRFGGRRLPLEGLRLVFDPAIFEALCRRSGLSPQSTPYFPPYRWITASGPSGGGAAP